MSSSSQCAQLQRTSLKVAQRMRMRAMRWIRLLVGPVQVYVYSLRKSARCSWQNRVPPCPILPCAASVGKWRLFRGTLHEIGGLETVSVGSCLYFLFVKCNKNQQHGFVKMDVEKNRKLILWQIDKKLGNHFESQATQLVYRHALSRCM